MISLDDIRKEIEIETSRNSITPSDGFIFCKEYIDNNKVYSIDQFLKINIWDWVKYAYFIKSDGKKSIDECIELIDLINKKFGDFDYIKFKNKIYLLFIISCYDEDDMIFQYLREDNKTKENAILDILSNNHVDVGQFNSKNGFVNYKDVLKDIKSRISYNDLSKILSFIEEDNKIACDLMSYVIIYKHARSDLNSIDVSLSFKKNINSSMRKKIICEYFNKYYNSDAIIEEHKIVSQYIEMEGHKIRNEIRTRKRENTGYSMAMSIVTT